MLRTEKKGCKLQINICQTLLCDIRMPQMDGYLVLRDLKENPSTVEIPIVYVIASTEKSEVQRAMEMGADGYVRKPFDTKELIDAINKCLNRISRPIPLLGPKFSKSRIS